MVVGSLVAKLGLNSAAFSGGLDKAQASLRGFGGQAGKAAPLVGRLGTSLLRTGASAAGLVGVGAMLLKAARTSEQFNQAMNSSLAIMGDVDQKTRRLMETTAREVVQGLKFSATEAAQAYYYLASAGLDVQQQMAALRPSLVFAQAGMFDASRATDILTDALSALGLASKNPGLYQANLERVGDVTVKAATRANASVEQFGDALLNKGALAAKMAGMEVEEAMSILMVYADKGFAKGVQGGEQLWIALRDLKTQTVQNADAFEQMGITIDIGGGKMARMADIIENMEKAFAGMGPLQQQAAMLALGMPMKSVAAIQTLLGESAKMRENLKTLLDAHGNMQDVADKQLTPFAESWKQIKDAMSEVAVIAGTPVITKLGTILEETARGLKVWLKPTSDISQFGFDLSPAQLRDYQQVIKLQQQIWTVINSWYKKRPDGSGGMWSLAERQPEAYKKLQEQYATVLAAREALEKTAAGGDPLEPSPEAQKAITELAEKFDNLGKTAREIELGKIEELGATPEQLRIADQLLRQIDLTERANKTWKEMREAAQKAIEDNQTPMERFQASMQDLNKLLDYGLLSWEQYARARQKAFEGATGMKQTPFGAPLLRAGTQEAITAERRHEFGSEIEAANERMINQIAEQLEVQRRQLQVQEETRDGIKAWKQAEPIDL